MSEAFVYDAVRTPRGRGKATGALHGVRPITLVAGLIEALRERHPSLDAAGIDDIVLGIVTPTGDQGANLAKTAALVAGLPDAVPGVQLNRFCASALEAVNQAAARVRSGWEDLIIAGGVESMSRVAMGSDGGPWANDAEVAAATGYVPQGIGADLIATIEGFTREDVDAYAAASHARAAAAQAEGRFARTLVPVRGVVSGAVSGAVSGVVSGTVSGAVQGRDGLVVPVRGGDGPVVLDRDETIRPGTTVDTLAGLKPAFAHMARFDAIALERYPRVSAIDHVHHAGNSSGIVDGAALVLVGSEAAGVRHGLTPRARIVSVAVTGSEPTIMLTGPGPASLLALKRARLSIDDIDLIEINEAFAAVPLRLMRDLGDYPHAQTNVNGGAIAMGHPLGATGAMILGTLIDELHRQNKRYGLATLCVGGGMGIATVVERV